MIARKSETDHRRSISPITHQRSNDNIRDDICKRSPHRCRFYSTPVEEEHFRKEGLLDENGLTIFDTLHEMIHGSCRVYAQNELFGTFNPSSEKFEYMTYDEFGAKVNQCRSMLKNLGTFFRRILGDSQ